MPEPSGPALPSARWFSDVKIIKKESYSGIEDAIILIVPVASLSIQLVEFVWTHFTNKKNSNRTVIINGKKRKIVGYSKDEVIEILETLKSSPED